MLVEKKDQEQFLGDILFHDIPRHVNRLLNLMQNFLILSHYYISLGFIKIMLYTFILKTHTVRTTYS